MKQTFHEKAAKFLAEQKQRKRWRRVVVSLALVVAMLTSNMLMLPAVTLETETDCGLTAHTHGEDCYAFELTCGMVESAVEDPGHTHTDECKNGEQVDVLVCTQEVYEAHEHSEEGGCYGFACGQVEYEAHTHGEGCYVAEPVLTCEIPLGHAHSDSCYEYVNQLTCNVEEGEGAHSHSESCYDAESNLICGVSESAGHVHGDGCWESIKTDTLQCTLTESPVHEHELDSCYGTVDKLVCEKLVGDGHTHDDSCIGVICTQLVGPGHAHDETCYAKEDVYVCGEEERPAVAIHAHDETCYTKVLKCTMEEHEHGEACYPDAYCGYEAHAHEDACYTAPLTCEDTTEGHEHGAACYGELELTCGKEEHEHVDECYVVPEKIAALIAKIDALPTEDDYVDALAEFGDDMEACVAYSQALIDGELGEAYDAYMSLTDDEKAMIPNADGMVNLYEYIVTLLESVAVTLEETPADMPYLTAKWVAQPNDANDPTQGVKELHIYCVDEEGNNLLPNNPVTPVEFAEVPGTHNIRFDPPNKFPRNEYHCIDCEELVLRDNRLFDADGYEAIAFKEAYIKVDDGNGGFEKTLIHGISYNERWLRYNETEVIDEATQAVSYTHAYTKFAEPTEPFADVYFVYEKSPMAVIPTEINKNIRVDLFNYGSNINDKEVRILDFMNSSGTQGRYWHIDGHGILDARTSSYRPIMSRVQNSDGYPVVKEMPQNSTIITSGKVESQTSTETAVDGKVTFKTTAMTDDALSAALKNFAPNTTAGNGSLNATGSLQYLFDKSSGYVAGTANWESYDTVGATLTHFDRSNEYRQADTSFASGEVLSAYQKLRETAVFNQLWGYGTKYRSMHFEMEGDGGLFQMVDGYYQYRSDMNAAYFNGERFEVYDGLISPGHWDSDNSGNNWYNFMPFNKPGAGYDPASDAVVNTYKDFVDADGESKKTYILGSNYHPGDLRNHEDFRESVVDTWYGMTMEIDFFMPENGQMEVDGTKQDMIFEFSGDDDVWVYIDDVLILDIGGTHGREDAKINFQTGAVEFPGDRTGTTTTVTDLKSLYTLAFLEMNGHPDITEDVLDDAAEFNSLVAGLSEQKQEELREYLIDNGFDPDSDSVTFKNFSNHNLKFYYMERGGNIGYCLLKFNMPALPEESLMVTKTVEDAGDYVDDNTDYRFQVLKDSNNDGKYEESVFDEDQRFAIYVDGQDTGRSGFVGENGVFTLKSGESAVFDKMMDRTSDSDYLFYVKEILTDEEALIYEVSEGTVGVTRSEEDGENHFTTKDALSAEGVSQMTVFTNSVKPGDLAITKQVQRTDGGEDLSGEFTFEVEIPAALAGSYDYVITTPAAADAPTQTPVEVSSGKLEFAVPTGEGADPTYAVAQITLQHNYTATIKALPAGTVATVTELTTDGYAVKWTNNGSEMLTTSVVADQITPSGTEALLCTNTTGVELPETGGMGTQVYITVGTVLMVGAGALLVEQERRRRRSYVK